MTVFLEKCCIILPDCMEILKTLLKTTCNYQQAKRVWTICPRSSSLRTGKKLANLILVPVNPQQRGDARQSHPTDCRKSPFCVYLMTAMSIRTEDGHYLGIKFRYSRWGHALLLGGVTRADSYAFHWTSLFSYFCFSAVYASSISAFCQLCIYGKKTSSYQLEIRTTSISSFL